MKSKLLIMEQKALPGLVIGYSLTLPSLRPVLWPRPAPGRFPAGLSLLRLFHFPYIVLSNEILSPHFSSHLLAFINSYFKGNQPSPLAENLSSRSPTWKGGKS